VATGALTSNQISLKPQALYWTNKARVSWLLVHEEENKYLSINCPYGNVYAIFSENEQNLKSVKFLGGDYYLVEADSNHIFCGRFETRPVENDWHVVEISPFQGPLNTKFHSKEYISNTKAWTLLKSFGISNDKLDNYTSQINSIQTFFDLENMLKNKDYAGGYQLINEYFAYFKDFYYIECSTGIDFGTPVGTYGLLMLRKIFEFYHLKNNSDSNQINVEYNFTTVLVGKSHGKYPDSVENINEPSAVGEMVYHTLIPDLITDDYKILRDCLFIFSHYIHAISEGVLNVKLNFVYLESVDVLCEFKLENDVYCSVMKTNEEGSGQIKKNISSELINKTNLWMYIFPDHRQLESPIFSKLRFITGGCSCSDKPILIADDHSFFKKCGDLGSGNYSDEERRININQWLKHEYYHYLFNVAFKEYKFEQKGHDWFDRNFWPKDFEGRTEPVFYDQALRKRFIKSDIPIWLKLSGKIGSMYKNCKYKIYNIFYSKF
jgi:hypothetical protein